MILKNIFLNEGSKTHTKVILYDCMYMKFWIGKAIVMESSGQVVLWGLRVGVVYYKGIRKFGG